MILDVGCGEVPLGSVNVDLHVEGTTHRGEHNRRLDPHKIPNFVRADMNTLPFKDGVFRTVVSNYALEHITTPYKALKEMLRVSSKYIDVQVPHRLDRAHPHNRSWDKRHHVSLFTRKWFGDLARKLGLKILVCEAVSYRFFPHRYIPLLRLPYLLRFHAEKGDRPTHPYASDFMNHPRMVF